MHARTLSLSLSPFPYIYIYMYVQIRRHQRAHARTRAHRSAAQRQSSGIFFAFGTHTCKGGSNDIVGGWEGPPCVLVPPAVWCPPAGPPRCCLPPCGGRVPRVPCAAPPCGGFLPRVLVPPRGVVAPTETIAMTA